MKANSDKCHFLCCSNSEVGLNIENKKIQNSKLDSKLKFNCHNHICQKAETKCNI